MLSDNEIKSAIEKLEIEITPFDEKHLGSVSYDLTVARFAKVWFSDKDCIDVKCDISRESKFIDDEVILKPMETALFCTSEKVKVSTNYAGIVVPRTTITKYPTIVYFGSLIDPGFQGVLTGHITNLANIPIKIPCGFRICQVLFFKVNSASDYSKLPQTKNYNINRDNCFDLKIDKEYRHEDIAQKENPIEGAQDEGMITRGKIVEDTRISVAIDALLSTAMNDDWNGAVSELDKYKDEIYKQLPQLAEESWDDVMAGTLELYEESNHKFSKPPTNEEVELNLNREASDGEDSVDVYNKTFNESVKLVECPSCGEQAYNPIAKLCQVCGYDKEAVRCPICNEVADEIADHYYACKKHGEFDGSETIDNLCPKCGMLAFKPEENKCYACKYEKPEALDKNAQFDADVEYILKYAKLHNWNGKKVTLRLMMSQLITAQMIEARSVSESDALMTKVMEMNK